MSENNLFNKEDNGAHLGAGTVVDGMACALNANQLTWEFECHQCHSTFETLVPRGPREEKALMCPICSSSNIERINVESLEAAFCGG